MKRKFEFAIPRDPSQPSLVDVRWHPGGGDADEIAGFASLVSWMIHTLNGMGLPTELMFISKDCSFASLLVDFAELDGNPDAEYGELGPLLSAQTLDKIMSLSALVGIVVKLDYFDSAEFSSSFLGAQSAGVPFLCLSPPMVVDFKYSPSGWLDDINCSNDCVYTDPPLPADLDWAQRMVGGCFYDPNGPPDRELLVAVLDTGADEDHELLMPALTWVEANLQRFTGDMSLCIVPFEMEGFPEDATAGDVSHGTSLAWLIAGSLAQGCEQYGRGIATGCQILPLRISNGITGDSVDLARGICVALHTEARVLVNTSTSFAPSCALWNSLCQLQAAGGVLFTSLGNCRMGQALYPGEFTRFSEFSNVVSIGAVDSSCGLVCFNNDSTAVDFLAPGCLLNVPRLYHDDCKDRFRSADGTSYAAPVAAGAFCRACQLMSDMTVQQVWDLFRRDIQPLGSSLDKAPLFFLHERVTESEPS